MHLNTYETAMFNVLVGKGGKLCGNMTSVIIVLQVVIFTKEVS